MLTLACALLLQSDPDFRELHGDPFEKGFSVGLHARIVGASGEAGSDLGYGDLFHSGYELGLEAQHLWTSSRFAYGFYASLAYDRLGGRRFTDDFGDSLRPDALDMATAAAGGRLDFLFPEPFIGNHDLRLGFYLGGGAAGYGAVDGAFTIRGTTVQAELFESSIAPFLDTGIRFGVSGRTWLFTIGLGIRYLGGPGRGRDVTDAIEPGGMTQVSFEVGWEFRF